MTGDKSRHQVMQLAILLSQRHAREHGIHHKMDLAVIDDRMGGRMLARKCHEELMGRLFNRSGKLKPGASYYRRA
jgi:hypothetical protein